MSTTSRSVERECRVFTRYLIGRSPEPYVVTKYVDAHRIVATYSSEDRFGRALTSVARIHPMVARSADAYAGLFAPRSLLRKKLVLLLAILETCAPSYQLLELAAPVSRPLLLLQVAGRGACSLLALLAGALVLFPLQLVLGLAGRRD